MNQKPGVMLYFDRLTFLDRLDYEQRGRLFTAIIRYARDGELQQIDDPMLGMAWDMLRPVMDLDTKRYQEVCEKRRQSALRRWRKDDDAIASECMPNTNTTPNSNPDQTQNQIQTQIESKIQTHTNTHSQSQKESDPVFRNDELLRMAREKKQEWDAERIRRSASNEMKKSAPKDALEVL